MKIETRADLHRLLPPNAVIAEVGVAEGRFSLQMLGWGASMLYLVDTWAPIPGATGTGGFPAEWHEKNWRVMQDNIEPFRDRVTILRGKSIDMASAVPDGSLDLLYLDGDHSYEGVTIDLTVWTPKVKPGGIVAGHDYLNPAYGVRRAVLDFPNHGMVTVIPEPQAPEGAGFWYRV